MGREKIMMKTDFDDDKMEREEVVRGVVFGRSVRSSFASLSVAVLENKSNDDDDDDGDVGRSEDMQLGSESHDNDDDGSFILHARLQFDGHETETVKALRSHFRRFCRLGDLLVIRGVWKDGDSDDNHDEHGEGQRMPRLVVRVRSVEQSREVLRVQEARLWNMTKVQSWQQKLIFYQQKQTRQQQQPYPSPRERQTTQPEKNMCADCRGHGGGVVEKRIQATLVANFLINMLVAKNDNDGDDDALTWATRSVVANRTCDDVRKRLNAGSGVLDVAGGSGHVAMALGLLGIRSTVVDPRTNVGKLPGRDRKIWKRALQKTRAQKRATTNSSLDSVPPSSLYFQPVIEYEAYRAWFGQKPIGVEEDFRNPDEAENIPVCDANDDRLTECTAIVALHPDEATDAVVNAAVQLRKPFVIIPCCVFCRLFPHRRVPGSDRVVSTYDDLITFLMSKDQSIRKATLPFVGANTVLWSNFEGGMDYMDR